MISLYRQTPTDLQTLSTRSTLFQLDHLEDS